MGHITGIMKLQGDKWRPINSEDTNNGSRRESVLSVECGEGVSESHVSEKKK